MQRLHSSSFPRKSAYHIAANGPRLPYPPCKNPGDRKGTGISARFSKSGIELFGVARGDFDELAEILNF